MNKAEALLHEIREKEYGNTLEDCIEWAIVRYFELKENKMGFTCIECKGKFHKHQMEIDERMCHDCFEEDTKTEYTNNLIRERVDRENYRKNLKTSYSSLGWKEEDHGNK